MGKVDYSDPNLYGAPIKTGKVKIIKTGKIVYDSSGRPTGRVETDTSTGKTTVSGEGKTYQSGKESKIISRAGDDVIIKDVKTGRIEKVPVASAKSGYISGNILRYQQLNPRTKISYETAKKSGAVIETTGKTSYQILRELRQKVNDDSPYVINYPQPVQTIQQQRPDVKTEVVEVKDNRPRFKDQIYQAPRPELRDQTTRTDMNRYTGFMGYQSTISEAQTDTSFIGKVKKVGRTAEFESQRSVGYDAQYNRIIALGSGFVIGFTTPYLHPIKTIQSTGQLVLDIATKPKEVRASIQERAITEPYLFGGEVAGAVSMPKITGTAIKGIKNAYVKIGSEYVPPENVISKQVLSGERSIPTAKSMNEIVSKFRESDVISYSPTKISGKVAQVGKKASTGYEDPGIYVSPLKEGSPYFTRIGIESPEYTFSILPDEGIGVPTGTIFKTRGVRFQPRNVVKQPGFTEVSKYLTKQGEMQSGYAYITKRSEIGQGNIPRQQYTTPQGNKIFELGTSEAEAVIPPGQEFYYTPKTRIGRIKGFEEYTIFNDRPVAIRRAKTKYKDDFPIDAIELTQSKISREAEITSSALRPTKNINAYSVISRAGIYKSGIYSSMPKYTDKYTLYQTSKSYKESSKQASKIYSDIKYNNYGSYSAISMPRANSPTYGSYGGSSGTSGIYGKSSSSGTSSQYTYVGYGAGGMSPYPTYPSSSKNKKKKKKKQTQPAYEVFVKVKGKIQKLDTQLLPESKATKRLTQFLDNTASASGFISRTNKRIAGKRGVSILPDRFYKRQKGGKEFIIEKRSRRISTRGELKQITRKGQYYAKMGIKRKNKRFGGVFW